MTDFLLIEHDDTEVIEVVTAGAQGPQGNPGPTGPAGSAGPTGAQGPMGDVTPAALAAVEDAETAAAEAAASADEAQAAADYVAGASGSRDTKSVSSLLADNTFTYTIGLPGTVLVGDVIRTRQEGFSYFVADSAATDYHITTAGGIKLYCQPTPAGHFNFAQTGADKTGVADCWDKLDRLLKYNGVLYPATGWYRIGPAIYFPPGIYYISQTVELKHHTVRLFGDSGRNGTPATILKWPAGVTGIVVHRANTIPGGSESPNTTAADGTIIEHLSLISTVITGPGGTSKSSHGIYMRAAAMVNCCTINDWGGDGIHIAAAAGYGGASEGNANGWRVVDCFIVRTENGVFCDGPDVNAGSCIGLSTVYIRRWTVWDSSFLGNTWINCQSAAGGRETNAAGTILYSTAFTKYGGVHYQIHPSAAADAGITTTPGTNSSVWVPIGTNGYYPPDWTGTEPSGFYRSGGPYLTDNLNAGTVFVGCYTEGGQGQSFLLGPQVSLGGFMGGYGTFIGGSAGAIRVAKGSFSYASTTISGQSNNVTINESDGVFLTLEMKGGATPTGLPWRLKATGDGLYMDKGNSGTAQAFAIGGAAATYPYSMAMTRLVLGGGINSVAQLTRTATAAPATGNYVRGDIIFITLPSAAGKVGWVCTTGGTAGSTAVFKQFGAIDP
jgi:hypothetical protein